MLHGRGEKSPEAERELPYVHQNQCGEWAEYVYVDRQLASAWSSSAKEALREHGSNVNWWKLVWFKGHIPKHAFVVWMVCRMKLTTKAKLKSWGCIDSDTCILCEAESESEHHLFFQCPFSRSVWKEVKRRNGCHGQNWYLG